MLDDLGGEAMAPVAEQGHANILPDPPITPGPFPLQCQSAGWIDGTTQEPGPVTGRTLHAAISGRRSGSAVTFIKTYQNWPYRYHVVNYGGTLNADGTEIDGSWQIPRNWSDGFLNWSGGFLMIRVNGTEEAIALELSEVA